MSTPQDFLKKVKEYYRFIPELAVVTECSDEFTRLTKGEADSFEGELHEIAKNYSIENDDIILNLVKDVFPILNIEEKKKLKNVAFGKIINTTVNALCIKSNDGFNNYCIVLNQGLLMLFHKHAKLTYAAADPNAVIFCNRGDHTKINSSTYKKWSNELIGNYKRYNTPIGTIIKLSKRAGSNHSINISVQELFILCHELGHFYNCDLEDNFAIANLINTTWSVVDDNKDHEIEYKADLTGFDLLVKAVKLKFNLGKKYCLLQVAVVFDILAMINPNESNNHPAPIDRICNIIQYFFGESFVEPYLKTYSEDYTFLDFFNSLED